MDDSIRSKLVPGAKVAVTQQIPMRHRVWTEKVEGEVVSFEQATTGSWYAHSADQRLWLDRLTVRKADGELLTLNLDTYCHIEVVAGPKAEA